MLRIHVVGLVCLLVLAGCGGDNDEGSSASPTATATETAAGSAGSGGDVFCDATEDNGATGASFGEVQAFASKSQLAQDVAEAQKAMQGVTPPDEIVDAWQTRKQYLVKLEAAVEALPAGGRLGDPSLVSDAAVSKAAKQITDFWFQECGA